MLTASRDGRRVAAMVLNSAVNDVRGIVQCLVPGCEAHVVLMDSDGDPATLIDDFMMGHDCDCNRFPPGAHGQLREPRQRGQGRRPS